MLHMHEFSKHCKLLKGMALQDPSYDPYGFAKVATRAASSEGGSAAACPANVQQFFQTIFSLANTPGGLEQINSDMNLCSDSMVTSHDMVNSTLAQYVQMQWVSAVSKHTQSLLAVPQTKSHTCPA